MTFKLILSLREIHDFKRRITVLIAAISLALCGAPDSFGQTTESATDAQTPLASKSFLDLTQMRQDLEKQIAELQSDVDTAATQLRDRDDLIRQYQYLESLTKNVPTGTPKALKDSYQNQLQTAKSRLDLEEGRTPKVSIEKELSDKKTLLNDRKHQKDRVEQKMNELINIEGPRQKFKSWMSLTFAGLVAMVISGFFVLAWRDKRVRRAIFAGQAGIQFVTLFSLVIAIILFGITGILQDKELAALLGGLSGYILGRNVGGSPPVDQEAEPKSQTQTENGERAQGAAGQPQPVREQPGQPPTQPATT